MKRSLLLALGPVLFTSIAAAAAPTEVGTIHAANGAKARTHRLLPWKALRDGASVPVGREIQCDAGCAIQVAGAVIDLAPSASVVLGSTTFLVVDAKRPAMKAAQVNLTSGSVVAHAGPKTPVLVSVAGTNALVASGSGEIVLASANEAGIANAASDVRVHDGKGWLTVEPGHAAKLAKGSSPEVRPLLAAPAWSGSVVGDAALPVALAFGSAASIGGSFVAPSGAKAFRVEIARDASFHDIADTVGLEESARSFASRPLAPGAYWARVVAVDEQHLAGRPGASLAMRVVAAELPPGGVAAQDRRVVLPESTSLRLKDAGDVELSIGKGFAPTPDSIAIDAKASNVEIVSFRLRGEKSSESAYALERRALHADIEITPHLPRWPADPLELRVKLADPSGRFDPAAVAPKLTVLVGIDEVKVDWKKDGAEYRARLVPRGILQNEVVRVIATDEHGAPLGRGFVEVDPRNDRIATK